MHHKSYHWCVVPAVEVMIEEEVIAFLSVLPTQVSHWQYNDCQYIERGIGVPILAVIITVFVSSDDACESHKSWQKKETGSVAVRKKMVDESMTP